MRQLEPGTGKDFLEIGWVVAKTFGYLAIFGIELHCHVGIRHDRLAADRRIFDIYRHILFLDVDRFPLVRTGWRLL